VRAALGHVVAAGRAGRTGADDGDIVEGTLLSLTQQDGGGRRNKGGEERSEQRSGGQARREAKRRERRNAKKSAHQQPQRVRCARKHARARTAPHTTIATSAPSCSCPLIFTLLSPSLSRSFSPFLPSLSLFSVLTSLSCSLSVQVPF
jgi:hypothetical protein